MNGINNKNVLFNNNPTRLETLRNSKICSKIDTDVMPFEFEWSYSWNSNIGLTNISNNNKLRTFFVKEQIGIILEYDAADMSKTMKTLSEHRNPISSFHVNSNCCWLVTADRGHIHTSMLIVWDVFFNTPICTLLSPFKMGVAIVKFTVDSKYLLTVSVANPNNGEQTIALWDWTSGVDKPICSTTLDGTFDPIVHITYCQKNSNYFCFTTEKRVFFMTWEEKMSKLTTIVPKQNPKQIKYKYTQSAYVSGFRQVVSASTSGLVIVWDDADYNLKIVKNTTVTNNKTFLKSVKLDEYSITTIQCDRHIITSNVNGDIFFYDASLRILYHLNKFVGYGITSIGMVNVDHTSKDQARTSVIENVENSTQNHVNCMPSLYKNKSKIGIDFTVHQDFKCDPFFISTTNCKIVYVDICKNKYIEMFEQCKGEMITAIEVHPEKPWVILGDIIGGLIMYDYQTKKTMITTNANKNQEHQITCVKYSPNGFLLCCGSSDGSFEFIDPNRLTSMMPTPFKWGDKASSIRHITFSKSSNYVVHTDNQFGIYLYGILPSRKLDVEYYGCVEAHSGVVRGITMHETTTELMIYSVGADHMIAIYNFDKTQKEPPELVKSMKTELWHEPQCMIKSSYKIGGQINLIISGSDLRMTIWNNNRCIRTTLGVNLDSPIKVIKESSLDRTVLFFCNDTDIGILRQPIDGNPYKNVSVLSSGKKLIDFRVSWDNKYLFTLTENSRSMLMWKIHLSYLDALENIGVNKIKAYSTLLEGGENGSEMKLLMEYFKTVQLIDSSKPETVVFSDFVNICDVSFIMRAMGYYPSETELCNMMYEMHTRNEDHLGHAATLITFEELVILYLNYKPKLKLKFDEIRRAFDDLVLNDDLLAKYKEEKTLTRKSFIYAMRTIGEKISIQELKIIFHTLMKTPDNQSSDSSDNIDSVHTGLPFTFTFEEIITDLFGFKAETEE